MDNIEKIKLNGIDYGVGSNQAKLVVTGTYDKEEGVFKLDKTLEKNKFYFIRLINSGGYSTSCVLGNFYDDTSTSLTIMGIGEQDPVPAICRYDVGAMIVVESGDYETILINENYESTCEVYELPFTLGGTE